MFPYRVLSLTPIAAFAEGDASYQTVVDVIKNQFSNANLVTVLAYAAGLAVLLVFTYWAVRKATRVLMSAFKRGKLRL